MLTLLLLRHAKAEGARGDDFARALTGKGAQDASEIGSFLAAHRMVPEIAFVSPAKRTSETFDLAVGRLGVDIEVCADDLLYNADEATILNRIGRIGPRSRVAIVVAHNPGIMEVAVTLAREGDRAEIERLRGRFPPGGLAVLSFAADDWSDACASGGCLDALVFPEDLFSGE